MATDTAFALAGLGGFNAHGAGFLQAARDNGVRPHLATVTSGQILVLAAFLEGEPDLRAGLIDRAAADNPFAQLQVALFGYPGVFRPAYAETLARLAQPPRFTDSLVDIFADRLLPAQQYVPARPDAAIEAVAATFNGSDVGVVFNAYDPTSGQGVLYGNDAARARLQSRTAIPLSAVNRPRGSRYAKADGQESPLLAIDAEAIKSALWLSLYGFERLPGGRMDGAYHRACIVSELHSFSRLIVARPLANGWANAPPPRSWFDVQDWQCEMWFSAGYKAEVDALLHINQLIEDGVITDPRFRRVEFHEVAPDTPAGYFNFFVEREPVFRAAYAEADALFKRLAAAGNRGP